MPSLQDDPIYFDPAVYKKETIYPIFFAVHFEWELVSNKIDTYNNVKSFKGWKGMAGILIRPQFCKDLAKKKKIKISFLEVRNAYSFYSISFL